MKFYLQATIVIAIIGWVALLFAPIRRRAFWIFGRSCAVALALVYLGLVIFDPPSRLALISLSGLKASFENPVAAIFTNTHILAFNLFIGSWQVEDSPDYEIPHLWILPTLLLTCLLGPVGFIAYILMRDIRKIKLQKEPAR